MRVTREGSGKRGGYRVLLCLQLGDKAFFLMGFAKSDMANIGQEDVALLKKQAQVLFSLSEETLAAMLYKGFLEELEDTP